MAAWVGPAITAGGYIGGALLGGGGGGSKSPYSIQDAQGSSFGVQGSSGSTSSRTEDFGQGVWGVQSPYLADLYGQAQNQFQTGGNQQIAQNMWGQNAQAMNSLLNPQANPLMEVYQQQMQQGLEQNILPTIRREAMGHGMVGGTRQGVAEGMALQQAQREQSQFAAQLYNQDRDRMLGALTQAPGLINAGLGIPWYGLNQYAGILGQPTVLDLGSLSTTEQRSSSFGQQGSQDTSRTVSGPKVGWVEENL